MTSIVLKSVLGGSAQLWARGIPSTAPYRASGLASSSRIGLDFGRPVRAGPSTTTTTTILETFTSAEEGSPASAKSEAGSNTQTSPSSSSPPKGSATADAPSPILTTPAFNVNPALNPRNAKDKLPRFNREPIKLSTNDPLTAPTHTLTVTSTRNNTILTFSDHTGPIFPTITAGSDKVFKKSTRNSYEAAHQAMLKMMTKILDYQSRFPYVGSGGMSSRYGNEVSQRNALKLALRVSFKGLFGQGRSAVSTAIGGPDGIDLRRCIVAVDDRTPIKIGGTRARKARRV